MDGVVESVVEAGLGLFVTDQAIFALKEGHIKEEEAGLLVDGGFSEVVEEVEEISGGVSALLFGIGEEDGGIDQSS